jgi:ligand-binding sensor domain-containing protein/nitrogen-specific signal transduction histidine kinase
MPGSSIIRILLLVAVEMTAPSVFAQRAERGAFSPLPASVRTSWTVEDGLPQNSILGLLQSRSGYIWIATQEGLARFDGVRFVLFNRQTVPGLPSNLVTSLAEDHTGRLWIGTSAGLASMVEGTFAILPGALNGRVVRTILEDRDRSLLVGTTKGAFSVRGDSVIALGLPRIADEWDVRSIVRHSDGSLWIGTEQEGLFRWDGRFLEHYGPAAELRGRSINALVEGARGTLWIGVTGGGLRVLQNGRFKSVTLDASTPDLTVQTLLRAPGGGVWAGTTAGVFFVSDTGAATTVHALSDDEESRRWSVYGLLSDREGSLWLGTFGRGLHQYAASHVASSTPFEFLNNDPVYCVFHDSQERLWVGTAGRGVVVWSREGGLRRISSSEGLPQSSVYTVHEDSRGSIWLGTTGGGLVEFRDRVRHVYTTDNGMPNNFIRALAEDREGFLWIGTRSGLCRMSDGLIENFTPSQGLTSLNINTILTDRAGRVWVGTLGGGALRYDHDRFTTFTTADGFPSNDVRAIMEDADGTMWFGTDRGLVRHDGRGIRVVSTAQGLSSDAIVSIADDGKGHLWLSSHHGLMRIAREDLRRVMDGEAGVLRTLLLGRHDGMRSEECGEGQPAMARDREGRFWYPTTNGVVLVHPGELRRNAQPPLIVIEGMVVDGQAIAIGRPAVLPPEATDIEIQYTGLSFLSSNNLGFRYRLEGLQDQWVEAGPRRSAYFTSLEPGEYVFRVMARNADGVWNESAATLGLVVESKFHQSPWFRVLMVVVVLAGVALASSLRVRQVDRRRKELEQLVRERTAELERQMALARDANEFKTRLLDLAAHDLKSPLISIRGFAQLARQEPSTAKDAANSIHRLSQSMLSLINELLDASTIEQGHLQLIRRDTDLSSLVLAVGDIYRIAAERKQQRLEIEPAAPGSCLVHVDVGRMQACIENLVTNALKYSPPGTAITVRVVAHDDRARVCVRDQGPGLTPDDLRRLFGRFQKLSARPTAGEPSTGLGLSIVKQIVEMHGGLVEVEAPSGGGSVFCIDLPRVSSS